MSKDWTGKIDQILSQQLPENEFGNDIHEERKQEMIELLHQAAAELGKSPSYREFNNMDLPISADMMCDTFGTWNEAKKAAGLENLRRGRKPRTNIDETFFKEIDSNIKSYWLGALIARSSLRYQENGTGYYLFLGRAESHRYFIDEFSQTIESDYPVKRYEKNGNEQDQIRLAISNTNFTNYLIEAGYPSSKEDFEDLPKIKPVFRAPFIRGYLESGGYFSSNGWRVKTESHQCGETLQEWFEDFGVKRPTVSELKSGDIVVRVSNVFDIKTLFEACWPDKQNTSPSFNPYVKKIIEYLDSEYPYPENIEYLDG